MSPAAARSRPVTEDEEELEPGLLKMIALVAVVVAVVVLVFFGVGYVFGRLFL